MLQHYLSTSLRHFRRHKLTTGINVACLTIGLACFIGSHWLVNSSGTSDTHFADSDRIVVITQRNSSPNAPGVLQLPVTGFIAADHLRGEFPELTIARASDGTETGESLTPIASGDAKAFVHVRYADPGFLDVFPLKFLAGDSKSAFSGPRSAILAESTALQLFGSASAALGRNMLVRNRYDVTITGVIADIPHPSHMAKGGTYEFDILVSMDVYVARGAHDARREAALRVWTFTDVITYARLPQGLTIEALNTRLARFGERHVPQDAQTQLVFSAQPLAGLGMNVALGAAEGALSLRGLLYSLGVIVLLIACVNYANLATAVAATRAQEVGLRRVVGAGRWQVLSQHLFESACLSTAALVAAASIVGAILLIERPDGLYFAARAALGSVEFWSILAGMWVAVTIAAGAYPALVLANTRPIVAVRGGPIRRGGRVAAALVCLQFIAASFLLTVVLMLVRQNELLTKSALDGLGSPVVILRNNVNDAAVPYERLRAELLRQPHVVSVTGSQRTPWSSGASLMRVSSSNEAADSGHAINMDIVNYDYFATLGIPLAAGRVFDRGYANDEPPPQGVSGTRNVVIDRDTAATLGWQVPEEAVGQTIYNAVGEVRAPLTIVGVVEPRATSFSVSGAIYLLDTKLALIPSVRIAQGSVSDALAEIDRVWNVLVPNMPLQRQFADEVWEQSYELAITLTRLVGVVATFAAVNALLGLVGVSIHVIERRRREIGVRKTLGASVPRVLALLMRESSRPVILGNLIALPLAAIATQTILATFMSRMSGSVLPFVTSLVLTVAVAWLAIGTQAFRAARVKPAEVLRYE